jgi:hypothetical protein
LKHKLSGAAFARRGTLEGANAVGQRQLNYRKNTLLLRVHSAE